MSKSTIAAAHTPTAVKTRRAPLYVIISAWAIPVLVLGQFALLAVVPLALMLIGVLRDPRIRPLRWWAGLVAAAYLTPLAIWALRADRATSLSTDMSPIFAAIIVVAAVVVIVKLHTNRTR